jgi:hypothetical protein
MIAKGTFDIKMTTEPPFDADGGVSLGRMRVDKTFGGPLDATSQVHMLAVGTPVAGSAGYVAVERIAGALEGRRGSFVVLHMGSMNRGAPTLSLLIVPDSGTGELRGLSGRMEIQIVDGQHHYQIDYALG